MEHATVGRTIDTVVVVNTGAIGIATGAEDRAGDLTALDACTLKNAAKIGRTFGGGCTNTTLREAASAFRIGARFHFEAEGKLAKERAAGVIAIAQVRFDTVLIGQTACTIIARITEAACVIAQIEAAKNVFARDWVCLKALALAAARAGLAANLCDCKRDKHRHRTHHHGAEHQSLMPSLGNHSSASGSDAGTQRAHGHVWKLQQTVRRRTRGDEPAGAIVAARHDHCNQKNVENE
jgi:hypothetical protein